MYLAMKAGCVSIISEIVLVYGAHPKRCRATALQKITPLPHHSCISYTAQQSDTNNVSPQTIIKLKKGAPNEAPLI